MATCLCLRGTSTLSSTIHPINKSAISKFEIDSVPFGFFYVISDNFTSGIHSFLHIMSSRSAVPTIHTAPQPSPDASMNSMYSSSPSISSMHLVSSMAASFSSFCILSTNCLAAVYFARFSHDVSRPSIHKLCGGNLS